MEEVALLGGSLAYGRLDWKPALKLGEGSGMGVARGVFIAEGAMDEGCEMRRPGRCDGVTRSGGLSLASREVAEGCNEGEDVADLAGRKGSSDCD